MSRPSIAAAFDAVEKRIDAACRRAGRARSEVRLVAVSKRQPMVSIEAAIAAGHRCFGENRVQEAADKRAKAPDGVEWHLIGPLQSNKVERAVATFSTVHSVDRLKIARLLDRQAADRGTTLPAFVQVHLGDEASKHGFDVDHLEASVRPLIELRHVRWLGLMAIPPYEPEAERSRSWFRQLRQLRDQVGAWPEWHGFEGRLSMGMSHDFEQAIEEGATDVRVGTALFGERAPG